MSEIIYGEAKSFKSTMDRIKQYAAHQWPVLLLGETGVGKDLIAKQIHELSQRKSAQFIPVNCCAIPAGLFESELFGYERGAFSGAVNQSKGLAKMAHGGTLFLDEIGELDLNLQSKLLRLLETGEVRSVGSQKVETVNIRVIAATNVDLYQAVSQGRFRLDLLERLSVLRVQIPPLRERKEDIVPIAHAITERMGATLDPESLQEMQGFDWPGNVRQLRNILIRATVLGKNRISAELTRALLNEERILASMTTSQPLDSSLTDGPLEDIEKQVIVGRLKKHHGNRKETAKDLGIAKSTLHEKIRKWKQDPNESLQWPLARRSHVLSL